MDEHLLKYVKSWIDKANNDLRNVELLLKSNEEFLPTDTMAFHCQQAVEKFLKAYIIFNNEKILFTHNLADLVQICAKFDNSFESIIEKVETLTPFAVEIRYPDNALFPSNNEIKDFYQIAVYVKNFVLSRIKLF
jgi:HEPN domain-containing protein